MSEVSSQSSESGDRKGRLRFEFPVEVLSLLGHGFEVVRHRFPPDAKAVRCAYDPHGDKLVVVVESSEFPLHENDWEILPLGMPPVVRKLEPTSLQEPEIPELDPFDFITEGGRFKDNYTIGCPACGAKNTYETNGQKGEDREERCVKCGVKLELVFNWERVVFAEAVAE